LITPFTPRATVIGTVFAAFEAIGCWVGWPAASRRSASPTNCYWNCRRHRRRRPPATPSATATTACIQPLSFTALCMVRIVRPRPYWMSEPLTPAGNAGGNQA
jgi:hypothetical protein